MTASLPPGWSWLRLEQFASAESSAITDGPFGSNLKTSDYVDGGEVRVIRLGNLGVGRFVDDDKSFVSSEKFAVLTKHEARPGDLVVAALAEPVGRCTEVPNHLGLAMVKADCVRIRVNPAFDRKYLMHALNSPDGRRRAEAAAHGLGRLRINLGDLRSLLVPTAPLNEQRRIVAKIEALQVRSRRAREALDAVPPLLEKLRQSILAAAFRGDLTKDWRAKHKDVEPASKLLERIRAERRKKWEEAELAKMKAKGKAPKGDEWKSKYKEPEPVDDKGLPELPEGWCWAPLPTLGELARGKSKHRPRNDPALFGDTMPFIQTGEVARSEGRITAHSAVYSAFGVAQSRVFPRGTVCITIAANIADSGILEFEACFPDSVVGFVADGGSVAASHVELFIRTARVDLQRFAPATAQANINLEVLGQVAVPVPPRGEMVILVNRVELAMARIAAVASSHRSEAGKLQSLERATLAKAFRGELVPQDPNDESAEAMLARMRGATTPMPECAGKNPTRARRMRREEAV